MLERDIEIRQEFGEFRKFVQVRKRQHVGIKVKDAEAEIAGEGVDFSQKFHEQWFAPGKIGSVARGVLRDDFDFADSGSRHGLHLLQHVFNWTGFLLSPDFRNDAERTGIVASLGDFQVFVAERGVHVRPNFVALPYERRFSGRGRRSDLVEVFGKLSFFRLCEGIFQFGNPWFSQKRRIAEKHFLDVSIIDEREYGMEIFERRKEGVVLYGNVTPHEDDLFSHFVIMTEGGFRFFAGRRKESARVHEDVFGLGVFWIIEIFHRNPVGKFQDFANGEFEIDQIFRTAKIDRRKAEGSGHGRKT